MPKEQSIIIGFEQSKAVYKNAIVSKVHEDDIYDIKFSSGKIRTYVESVSQRTFNSGDYVSVVLTEGESGSGCKIIGKGRRIQSFSDIPIVKV